MREIREQCIGTSHGVPLYYYPNPHLHSFTLCLYLKAGPLYETSEQNGISHFLEHIVFRNANHILEGNLYKELDRLGLNLNGVTYREFIQFSISGATVHFEEAVKLLLLLVEPLVLTSAEIDIERKRIKAEIREASEKNSLDYFTNERIWEGTSLTQMIAGKPAVLDKIGKKALVEVKEELMSVGNCFFYLTGAIRPEHLYFVEKQIERHHFPKTKKLRDNLAPLPPVFFQRDGKIQIKNSDFTLIRLSFDLRSDCYTDAELTLLSDVLFHGDYCKIFQELSEKSGYIYSFSSCLEKYNNIGSMHLAYEVQPQNLEKSFIRALEIFQEMKTHIGDELEYVLAPYIDNSVMLLDDPEDLNWTMAYEAHVLGNPYKDLEDRKKAFLAVTPERLMEIATDIFRPENLLITMKGNKKKLEEDGVIERMEEKVREILR